MNNLEFDYLSRRPGRTGRRAPKRPTRIGPSRKRALLHHFGSAKGVAEAGLDDLAAVEGVGPGMARRIYEHFRGAG